MQEINYKQGKAYVCGQCQMKYRDKKVAEKCQAWCTRTKSCNLDIINQAIKDE